MRWTAGPWSARPRPARRRCWPRATAARAARTIRTRPARWTAPRTTGRRRDRLPVRWLDSRPDSCTSLGPPGPGATSALPATAKTDVYAAVLITVVLLTLAQPLTDPLRGSHWTLPSPPPLPPTAAPSPPPTTTPPPRPRPRPRAPRSPLPQASSEHRKRRFGRLDSVVRAESIRLSPRGPPAQSHGPPPPPSPLPTSTPTQPSWPAPPRRPSPSPRPSPCPPPPRPGRHAT